MADFCTVVIKGRLTKEPDYRHTPNGSSVCELSIAYNRPLQQGSKDKSVFVDVTAWGKLADACHNHLVKGSGVLVQGYLDLDKWQDRNGNSRQKLKIVAEELIFLSSANGNNNGQYQQQQPQEPEYLPYAAVEQQYAPPVRDIPEKRKPAFYGDPGTVSAPAPAPIAAQDEIAPDDIPF